jgi:hypothetical protein
MRLSCLGFPTTLRAAFPLPSVCWGGGAPQWNLQMCLTLLEAVVKVLQQPAVQGKRAWRCSACTCTRRLLRVTALRLHPGHWQRNLSPV